MGSLPSSIAKGSWEWYARPTSALPMETFDALRVRVDNAMESDRVPHGSRIRKRGRQESHPVEGVTSAHLGSTSERSLERLDELQPSLDDEIRNERTLSTGARKRALGPKVLSSSRGGIVFMVVLLSDGKRSLDLRK